MSVPRRGRPAGDREPALSLERSAHPVTSPPYRVNAGPIPLSLEWVDPDGITRSSRPIRRSDRKTIKTYARLIHEFGFVVPILIDEHRDVLLGDELLQAAIQLELAQVPVVLISHLSSEQKRVLTIAYQRLPERGFWDKEVLFEELTALTDLGFDLELTGFEIPEFDALKAEARVRAQDPGREDEIPEAEATAVAEPGDVWLIGEHRLVCGDARDPATIAAVMKADRAAMTVTDPPYNVPIDGHVSGLGAVRHREFAMASGEMSKDQFIGFLTDVISQIMAVGSDGSLAYVFMDWRHLEELLGAASSLGLELINLCVWNKSNGGMGSLYRSKHELVVVIKVREGKHRNNVELGKHRRNRTNVWDYAGVNTFRAGREDELASHPTCKPVAMIADAIRDVTRTGDIVFDPFCGSGTILIAAETVGRKARAVEIDPIYVDVAIRRWESFTGKHARLAADGRSFEEVSEDRLQDSKLGSADGPRAPQEGGA
ncbi:DNA modification methylase [Microvirga pudoricolor]|uniref:DNA modification methylase n=1 Tax=Microvirga pudoricolor TaxID=2778729 RepID=UPI00194EF20F|nr:DNA modification methylase [Microvirga pudoricolor]MBM6595330.1 DNA modification methylase [Microvirga pudoricolor]